MSVVSLRSGSVTPPGLDPQFSSLNLDVTATTLDSPGAGSDHPGDVLGLVSVPPAVVTHVSHLILR